MTDEKREGGGLVMLFADIIKKRDEYFFLIFTILTILTWFLAFSLNTSFEGTDIIIEGAYFFVALCSFFIVKRLSINLLSLGWSTFTYGLLIDLLDEFTHEPTLVNTEIEGLLTAMGLLLIGIGIYKEVQHLQQEIAQRKSAEEELKESEQRLDNLISNTPAVIYSHKFIDGEQKITYISDNIQDVLGFEPDDFVGNEEFHRSCIHPDDRESVFKEIQKLIQGETNSITITYRFKDSSGNYHWLRDTHRAISRENNETQVVGAWWDITERKRAEEQVKEINKDLEKILDNVPAMIWYKDTDNNFIRVNKAAAEATGMKPEEIEGKSAEEVYPNQAKEYYEDDLEIIKSEEPKTGIIEKLGTVEGEERWVRTDKVPYYDKDGNITGVIVLSIDITERKKAEEREQFLHSLLRHDVLNKFQVVEGYLELLKEETEENKEYVDKALEATKESEDIIQKVRTLRKVKGEELEEIELKPVVQEVLDENKAVAEENGFELIENCSLGDCRVKAGGLLKRLFSNLIENAIKHSNGTKIRISGKEKDQEVICSVEDDGKGIPDEQKDKIFKRGFKNEETGGTGLGSYLAKEITENYGGKIEARDSELGGARFDVHLKTEKN
ncbi:hypothetical protein C9439_00165 [archaeon SCG-AAA382B04]|nr:hypothetical protein C9439_00165 [archaeon SCG-AAA382B04]